MTREAVLETGGAISALAVAAAIALAPVTPAGPLLALGAIAAVVAWIVWRDAADFTIPDGAAIALAALAFGARLSAEGPTSAGAVAAGLDGALCGAALWAVREAYYRLRGHDGLGFGDVKLAAAAGVLLGTSGFALALLAACLAGLAVALARGGRTVIDRLPLGALLAPAALAVWLAGLAAVPAPLG